MADNAVVGIGAAMAVTALTVVVVGVNVSEALLCQ